MLNTQALEENMVRAMADHKIPGLAIMQMDEGRFRGQPLLAPDTVRAMQSMQAPYYTVDGAGYGIRLQIGLYRGLKRVRHGGGIHEYHCSFEMLPQPRIGVIIMASRMTPAEVHQGVVNEIFDQLLDQHSPAPSPEPVAIEPDRDTWPLFCGSYLSPSCGLVTVAAESDTLCLEMAGKRTPLKAHSLNIDFGSQTDGSGITSVGFVPEAPGVPCRYLKIGGWTATRFEPDPAFTPDPALLASHAGSYLSPAAGQEDICLRVGPDGRLMARFSWLPDQEFPCTPLSSNARFASGSGIFTVADGFLLINGWKLPKAGASPNPS